MPAACRVEYVALELSLATRLSENPTIPHSSKPGASVETQQPISSQRSSVGRLTRDRAALLLTGPGRLGRVGWPRSFVLQTRGLRFRLRSVASPHTATLIETLPAC